MYEFPHELSNGVRLKGLLAIAKISGKSQSGMGTQPSAKSNLQKLIFNTSDETVTKSRY